MRGGLNTGLGAKRPGRVLSGPIFSGPDDCASLVRDLKWLIFIDDLDHGIGTFLIPLVAANGTEIETRY
jgi:hypothetical protein